MEKTYFDVHCFVIRALSNWNESNKVVMESLITSREDSRQLTFNENHFHSFTGKARVKPNQDSVLNWNQNQSPN